MKKVLKNLEEHSAEFSDGTKILDYSNDLIDLYYRATYDSLLKRKTDNYLQPFIEKSISAMMGKDRDELGIKSLDKLDSLVKETTSYFQSKADTDVDFIEYKITRGLFPWQKEPAVMDSKKNTLLCSRRAGKSYLLAAIAIIHCARGYDVVNGFKKKRSVLMLGLTSGRAKDVFWNNLLHFLEISGLHAKVDAGDLSIHFTNGAELFVRGNNSKADREKMRGADYSLIIIDECQSQNALAYLMTDILGPIIRGRDSIVFLAGTGSITNKGYWKDVTTGTLCSEWRHFTATMRDNPTLPSNAEEEVLRENGWDRNNITFRREYLAENVTDTTRLVYPIYHKYEVLPRIDYIAIGIDYGWNDKNAIVPLGVGGKKIYELPGTTSFNKTAADEVVLIVKNLYEKLIKDYQIVDGNIICIADNNDQTLSASIQKYCRIQNAYKPDRLQQIFDMRGALERGDLLVSSDVLTYDMEAYIWEYDEESKTVIYETDDSFFHSDVLAATRYSYFYLKNKYQTFK